MILQVYEPNGTKKYLPDNSALVTCLGYLSDAFKGCWWPPIGESPGWRRKSKQTTCSVYPWICLCNDAWKKVTQKSSDPNGGVFKFSSHGIPIRKISPPQKKNTSPRRQFWEKTHHSNLRTPWLTPDFYRFLLKSASFFDVYMFFSFLKKKTQKNVRQQKKDSMRSFLDFFQKLKKFCFNEVLLMKEILYHLRCIKPCKWCRISSINSIFFWNKKVLGF